MNIILKDYPGATGSVQFKSNWTYVLRVGPNYDVNSSIGVELSGEYNGQYNFDGIDQKRDYKLYEGKNISNLSEVSAFGIKKGKDLIVSMEVRPIPKPQTEEKILSDVALGVNGKNGIPLELILTGDFNEIPLDVDLEDKPYNLDYK